MLNNFTLYSLYIGAIFTFVSFSIMSLSHILILVPIFGLLFSKKVKLPKSAWALIALTVICMASVISNWDSIPHKYFLKSKYFLIGALAILPLRELFLNIKQKHIGNLLHAYLGFAALATLSGLIALYFGFNPLKFKPACHPDRACGMYGMYMSYGYGISFFTTLSIGLIVFFNKLNLPINKKFLWITTFINFLGCVLSFARGGWIGVLVSIPFFWFREKRKAFFKVIVLILVLFSASFAIPKVRETFFSKARMESSSIRISQFKAAFAAFKEKPLLGFGHRNFENHIADIKTRNGISGAEFNGHAHNNFLEHLASTGILGLLALLFFHFFWFLESFKRKDAIGDLAMAFNISVFVTGQFQYTLGDGENLFLIMAMYALSQVKTLKFKES